MNKTVKRIGLGLCTILVAGGIAAAADTSLSASQAKRIQNALGDSDLASWVVGLLQKDIQEPASVSYTVAAESSNHIDVTFQVKQKDALNRAGGASASNLGHAVNLFCYDSDVSTGIGYSTTAGTSALSLAGSDGAVLSLITGRAASVVTSATGAGGVRVSQTSATVPNQYLCCRMPDSSVSCSGVIDFN